MNDSIFSPNYIITPAIEVYLESIDRNRWLIDNVLLMPKHETWLHRDVRVSRVSGTTRIEGADLGEEAVGRLARQALPRAESEDERDNINALQAYEFIDFLSDQPDISVDELVIRQLNRYFIANAAVPLTPGAYRKGSNSVGNFTPPDPGDVPSLMRSFALWLREEEDEDEIHPVLKASIAHLHLVAVHPFWDGNGRTARGLEALLLQRSPFGFRKLLSVETLLLDLKDDYFASLQRSLGTTFSEDYDATPWLEFSTMVLKSCSDDLVSKTADWYRMMQQAHNMWAAKGWPQRQADGYAFAIQTGQITRSDYMEITGVSPATASRDLAELVEAKVFTAEGKTRTRVYYPLALGPESSSDPPEEQMRLLVDS
jgi:Fic family protein